MKKLGAARRAAIEALLPAEPGLVVDVGADHGHVAAAVGAIATERAPHRAGRSDVPWVIADGLAPFRAPDVAIIAGMGANTIEGILARGPHPRVLIAHAQDDPPRLRIHLARTGWRIEAERLAYEGRRYAVALRAVRGEEPASGLALHWGPRLLETGDPLLDAYLRHELAHQERVATACVASDPAKAAAHHAHVRFLRAQLGHPTQANNDPS